MRRVVVHRAEDGRVGVTCVGRKVTEVERECGIRKGDTLIAVNGIEVRDDSGHVVDAFRTCPDSFEVVLHREHGGIEDTLNVASLPQKRGPYSFSPPFEHQDGVGCARMAHRLRTQSIRRQQLSSSQLATPTFSSPWITQDSRPPWMSTGTTRHPPPELLSKSISPPRRRPAL